MSGIQTEDVPSRLREMYVEVLRQPFPTRECCIARMSDQEHGDLVLHLADIAGIASHGSRLDGLSEAHREEFVRLCSKSFFEMHPRLKQLATAKRTPELYRLLYATEEARLLIRQYLRT